MVLCKTLKEPSTNWQKEKEEPLCASWGKNSLTW